MSIPTYDQFIWPLVKFLGEHPDGLRSTDVYRALAERVGLSEEEQEELLPSGRQAVFHNRIGWAHDRLKRAGYTCALRRGVWAVTPDGQELLRAHPNGVTDEEVERIAKVGPDSRLRDQDEAAPASAELDHPEKQSPEERIDVAVRRSTRASLASCST